MVSARRESERSRDRAIKSDTGAAMRARRRAVARQGHVIGQRQSASPSARGTTRKHAPPADGAFHDVRPQRSRDGDRGERRLTLRRSQERARIRGAIPPAGCVKINPAATDTPYSIICMESSAQRRRKDTGAPENAFVHEIAERAAPASPASLAAHGSLSLWRTWTRTYLFFG